MAEFFNVHICSLDCIHLTADDVKILAHLAHGASNREIAGAIGMHQDKVRDRLHLMYGLCRVQDRTQLAVLMVRQGIIQ